MVPFVAVVEELSFRRAAVRLGVTPAAVSKAVQILELELGVKLLERTSRAVALTRDGAMFFERCKTAVTAIAGARSDTAAAGKAPQGEALVSAPFLVAPTVCDALATLRQKHPRLLVKLEITDALAKLGPDRVDVAVRIGGNDDTLVQKALRDTRWATVASPAYLARRGAPTAVDDLSLHECLVFVAPNGRRRAWTFKSDDAFAPHAALLVDYGPALLDAARADMGIAQVLDFMVDADLKSGRLVRVLDHDDEAGPTIRALSLPGRRSPNVKAIVDALLLAFTA
ncbi:MAG TPA: LysR family transcriptional regulator [Myxococcota bacterium]